MKLVQLYKQIKEENEGSVKVLVPRRSSEEREKNYRIATLKKIQEYIKNGSKGDLDLRDTPITSLPDNLTKVGGSLDLYGTKITSLPDNLTVEDTLILVNTPITSLSKNLKVGGNLYLLNTKITSLPDNLTVRGKLNLWGTPITNLPNNLTVGGNLDLFYTKITELPKDLKVRGSLNITKTPLSKQYTLTQIAQMAPGVKGNIIS